MAFVIDGTTGIATVDGSVSAPSQRGQDSNSGISYAADTIKFSTNGVERMSITNSGVVGAGGGKLVDYSTAIETAVVSTSAGQGQYSGAVISISYAAASSSNKLLLIAQYNISINSTAATYGTLHIGGSPSSYRGDADGNRNRISTSQRTGNDGGMNNHNLVTLISSPATSSTAYDIRVSHSNDATHTVYLNRTNSDVNQNYEGRAASSITILEFEP
tara:strand:+ start:1014 stop:1664 length:651 start_codon:yes stop_codon:yes gene_type:complete